MRAKVLVGTLLMLTGCGASALQPQSFDASKGTAIVWIGPPKNNDSIERRRACLLELRSASGDSVLDSRREDLSVVPLEVNPGGYRLTVGRCVVLCDNDAWFDFELNAKAGHVYRVQFDRYVGEGLAHVFGTLSDETEGKDLSTKEAWECSDPRDYGGNQPPGSWYH